MSFHCYRSLTSPSHWAKEQGGLQSFALEVSEKPRKSKQREVEWNQGHYQQHSPQQLILDSQSPFMKALTAAWWLSFLVAWHHRFFQDPQSLNQLLNVSGFIMLRGSQRSFDWCICWYRMRKAMKNLADKMTQDASTEIKVTDSLILLENNCRKSINP